jgi:hypothetical protein
MLGHHDKINFRTPDTMKTAAALSALVLGLCSLSATVTAADVEERYEVVRALGMENGVALACGYVGETRRMKRAMVDNLPKERALGLAFEESTNAAYLAFLKAGEPCPAEVGFSGRVDAAINQLQATFAESAEAAE